MTDYQAMTPEELTAIRQQLINRMSELQDLTPGSFQEEWGRCGKTNCHCAQQDDPGHGPHRSVLRYQAGRTIKRAVPAALVDTFKSKVARWDEFARAYSEVADIDWELSMRELAHAKHPTPPTPPTREAEKGGSRTRTSTS
jgi:hypothetical protein